MHFPVFPIIAFWHAGVADMVINIAVSAVLVALTLGAGIDLFVKSALHRKYSRKDSAEGFAYLAAAAIVAVFGVYNIILVLVLAASAYGFVWWFAWKLVIRIVIWQFLIKFVIWRVILLNAWVALTGKEPKKEGKGKAKAKGANNYE
jgi:hypothetical protein